MLNLQAVRARRRREEAVRSGARPSPDQMYEWIMAETGCEETAQREALRWANHLARTADGAK